MARGRGSDLDIEDFIDREDPGITLLCEWAGQPGANASTFLPRDWDPAKRTLLHCRVTTRSILGAIVFETGGIAIAEGLIRLWGSGPGRSLLQANHSARIAAGCDIADILIVGDDALGGLFALNGGGSGQDGAGEAFHLPYDEAEWCSLEVGHSGFVAWYLTGNLDLLYGEDACTARLSRCAKPAFDRVLAANPFTWMPEGRAAEVSLREVNADEYLSLRIESSGFRTG